MFLKIATSCMSILSECDFIHNDLQNCICVLSLDLTAVSAKGPDLVCQVTVQGAARSTFCGEGLKDQVRSEGLHAVTSPA